MNETISVMIVEDQLLVAEDIRLKLEKHGMHVTGLYVSGEEAIERLHDDNPDLVLMDINLAGKMDGVEAAELMQRSGRIPVVYLSELSDQDTFRRARKTMPESYLTKPFRETDLVHAIEIAFNNTRTRGNAVPEKRNDFVFLRTDNQVFVKVRIDDILFLRAERAYCDVVCADKTYTLSNSMNQVAEQIGSSFLIRIHRSYMANVNHITGFDGNVVRVGNHELQMSKEMKNDVMAQLRFIR
ncbi:MAG TPA: response regulator [Ohtaekwangia sp.]|nr:response regulator [Ohtaekwangia sp.]